MAKKILKRISLICLALLVGVGAFLLPTLNLKPNNTQLSHFAYADSISDNITFYGSNFFMPIVTLQQDSNSDFFYNPYFITMAFSFSRSDNGIRININENTSELYLYREIDGTTDNDFFKDGSFGVYSLDNSFATTVYNPTIYDYKSFFDSDSTVYIQWRDPFTDYTSGNVSNAGIEVHINSNSWSTFNCNPVSVQFGSVVESWGATYNFVRYYDNNNNYLEFMFLISPTTIASEDVGQFLRYENRTYFLTTAISDNVIYQTGYDSGYSKGENDGYNSGYVNGYNNGRRVGKNEGYYEGLEQNNSYTFDRLISAVLDVPVRTFTSLFNFTILGVNLAEFMLGLFTFCIIITLVRWCL